MHPVRPLAIALAIAGLATLAAQPLVAQQVRPGLPGSTSDSTRNRRRTLGIIDGVVSDSNLVPIQAAQVSIVRTGIRIGTGPNGRFRIVDVPPGEYIVIVRRVGFHPTSAIVQVQETDTLRLSYTLERLTTMLDTVVISEKRQSLRMMEFEARRKVGFGQFMTQDEIEKRNSVFATELFRKFPSINVSPSQTSALPVYYALSRREGGNPNVGACPMQVFLDGVRLPTPFNLELLPSPKEFAGIEVYSGASTTPPQYAGYNSGCGVILVWTRDGY
jgi:hypothetical protein